MKKANKGIPAKLGLKEIREINCDFNDVIKNIEKLLGYYYSETKDEIRKFVKFYSEKFSEKIENDYDEFMLVSCQVYYDGYLLSLSKKHDKV